MQVSPVDTQPSSPVTLSLKMSLCTCLPPNLTAHNLSPDSGAYPAHLPTAQPTCSAGQRLKLPLPVDCGPRPTGCSPALLPLLASLPWSPCAPASPQPQPPTPALSPRHMNPSSWTVHHLDVKGPSFHLAASHLGILTPQRESKLLGRRCVRHLYPGAAGRYSCCLRRQALTVLSAVQGMERSLISALTCTPTP